MTKDILKQYDDLQKEIKEVNEKIRRTERQIEKIEREGDVKDAVKGGSGGRQHFHIQGFPNTEYGKKRALLASRMDTLYALEIKLEATINSIESYISNIEDSHIRRIVSLRFVENLSWGDVARRIGGGNTEDSVKKMFYRYMEKNK